jgi:cell division protein FtsZ
MTLEDMTTASEVIYDVVDPEANIIVGAVVDERLEGEIHVTVIATGFENGQPYRTERPATRSESTLYTPSSSQDSGANIPQFLRQRQLRRESTND